MSKGVVIHLDNDKRGVLEPSKNLFDQVGLDLEYIICDNKEIFQATIEANGNNLKALIFDLLSSDPSSGELHQKDAEFIENIKSSFIIYNIPIFVFSGYLQALDGEFENSGTVFKIDKGSGFNEIVDKISKFYNSGFIDVFSPNGKLIELLSKDLNISFTKQFKKNTQIEETIDSIINSKGDNTVERVQKVFQRIALKSLMSSLLAPEIDETTGELKIDFLNPVEHYVQRISPFEFWTGDIFLKKDGSKSCVLIVTPRCNVASKSFENLLACKINLGEFPEKKDKIGYALTDKPETSGYDRFLPPCPLFEGGKVVISNYQMINKKELSHEYFRAVSLSDELTNEILGKFGSYFFRSGINPWDKDETIQYIAQKI